MRWPHYRDLAGSLIIGNRSAEEARCLAINTWLEVIRSRLVRGTGQLLKVRERRRAYDAYLSALLIYAASRLIIIIGVFFGNFAYRQPVSYEMVRRGRLVQPIIAMG